MRLGKNHTHIWEEEGSRQREGTKAKSLSGHFGVFKAEYGDHWV